MRGRKLRAFLSLIQMKVPKKWPKVFSIRKKKGGKVFSLIAEGDTEEAKLGESSKGRLTGSIN